MKSVPQSENFDQLVLGGVDYSFIEGDKIDLSALLDIATGKNVTDYVEVTQSGSDITVRVDLNGGGSFETGASEVYTLTGIGTDGADPLRRKWGQISNLSPFPKRNPSRVGGQISNLSPKLLNGKRICKEGPPREFLPRRSFFTFS